MSINLPASIVVPRTTSRYPYSVINGGPAEAAVDTTDDDLLRNQLLASLPDDELDALRNHLERVEMAAGEVIYQYGSQSRYVYFPATCIVSLLYDMEDGVSAEVAIVGKEGLVGVGLFMAGETMPGLAQVQCGGYGYRLSARILKQEFERSGSLQHTLLCYTQALMVEIAQNAVCARHHSIKEQLARCLLLSLDRSSGPEMALTHEMIGVSLGVRRECVTVAAGKLRAEGLIEYKRGHITVVDREGLEAQSCECYEVMKRTFDRLLPQKEPRVPAHGSHGNFSGLSHRQPQRPKLGENYLRAMK